MAHKAIAVFTAKTVEQIQAAGGSAAWVLNRSRTLDCEYVLCTRNRHSDWGKPAPEEHRTAFLLGRIADVVPAAGENEERWLIRISEYALIDVPNAWKGWRNPVRYTTLEELGIDVESVSFEPMPQPPVSDGVDAAATETGSVPSIIAESRARLAKAFGVSTDQIEITIRG